jgi:MFS family permease
MIGMGAGISMFWPATSYFIKPLHAEFGWSRGQVSLTTSIGVLLTSLAMPLVGVLIDRYGPRAFILAGSILFSLSYLALSAMSGQFIIFIAIVLMIGLTAGPATSPLIFTRPLVGAFAKSRGVALGLSYSGTVIISSIVQPTLQHVISDFGWRAGYRIMAPIGLVCVVRPRRKAAREASRKPGKPLTNYIDSLNATGIMCIMPYNKQGGTYGRAPNGLLSRASLGT